jgi:parvulin-like peptidyl-prolyl isomerase
MEEFSVAAKELFEAGVEGAISQPAVTDYGVHILYLSRIIPSNGLTVGLNDYVSYGERETVYEKIEKTVREEKVNNVFNVWQNNKIGYYQTEAKVIVRNESAFADLKETK